MKPNKTLFILLLMTIILSSVIYAPPPVTQEGDTLTIAFPKNQAFPTKTNLTLHFHIHDSINRRLDASEVTCFIHLYNEIGSHQLIQPLMPSSSGLEVEVDINNTLFPTPRDVPFVVECNTSTGGVALDQIEHGFTSSEFFITNSGLKDETSGTRWMTIMFAVGILASLLFYMSRTLPSLSTRLITLAYAIINTVMLVLIMVALILNPFDIEEYNGVMITYLTVHLIGFVAFIWFWGVDLVLNVFKPIMNKKEEDDKRDKF